MSSIWDTVTHGNPAEGYDRGRLSVRRPLAGERLVLLPLEPGVGWFKSHFLNRRSRPCLRQECPCRDAKPPWEFRYDGWIVCLDYHARRVVLAHLTRNTWLTTEALRDRSLVLRGCRMTLERQGTERNGPVKCGVERHVIDPHTLPKLGVSHRIALLHVWFNGSDDYEEVAKARDLYGAWAPVEGADSQKPPPPPEEDGYHGEF